LVVEAELLLQQIPMVVLQLLLVSLLQVVEEVLLSLELLLETVDLAVVPFHMKVRILKDPVIILQYLPHKAILEDPPLNLLVVVAVVLELKVDLVPALLMQIGVLEAMVLQHFLETLNYPAVMEIQVRQQEDFLLAVAVVVITANQLLLKLELGVLVVEEKVGIMADLQSVLAVQTLEEEVVVQVDLDQIKEIPVVVVL
jgi:hypothetical protein